MHKGNTIASWTDGPLSGYDPSFLHVGCLLFKKHETPQPPTRQTTSPMNLLQNGPRRGAYTGKTLNSRSQDSPPPVKSEPIKTLVISRPTHVITVAGYPPTYFPHDV